jgi:hypothetical protein
MSESNSLNIRIHGFYQQSDPVKDEKGKETGEVIVRDYVKYGPPHLMDRHVVVARVDRLMKVTQPREGSKNPQERTAWDRWQFIKPHYEAWKKGEELPENGIPLAACNFLRAEDAALLKRHGIRSVQELADLHDTAIDKIPIPSLRSKKRQAAAFLEAQDLNKAAAEMAKRDEEIAELKKQMATIRMSMPSPDEAADVPEVDENGDRIPKRRGRPPKVHADIEAA